jgi:hypothetical protein
MEGYRHQVIATDSPTPTTRHALRRRERGLRISRASR